MIVGRREDDLITIYKDKEQYRMSMMDFLLPENRTSFSDEDCHLIRDEVWRLFGRRRYEHRD